MWVVSIGDPFSGLTLYGPFESEQAADDWADTIEDNEYHVVQVQGYDLSIPNRVQS